MIVDPYQSLASAAADRDPADLRRSALPCAPVTPAPDAAPPAGSVLRQALDAALAAAPGSVSLSLRRRAAAALRGAADRLESTGTPC